MYEARKRLSSVFKRNYDKAVCQTLKAITLERKVAVVHAYIPIKGEINITEYLNWALKSGIKIVCPKVLPKRQLASLELLALNQLESGPYGTVHPAGNKEYDGAIDLVIMPGLAFDVHHNRLGYGGGYYDRFLEKHANVLTVALYYPLQLVEHVPVEQHDIKMSRLITEEMDRIGVKYD